MELRAWLLVVVVVAGVCTSQRLEYRSHDGTGNNLVHPEWGRAKGPWARAMVPQTSYTDGVGAMDSACPCAGVGLDFVASGPSPRLISNAMARAAFDGHAKNREFINEFHTYWGMLIAMDLTSTGRGGGDPPVFWPVPSGDEYLDPSGTGNATIFFSRASKYGPSGVAGYPRVPVNEATSFLDMSWLYPADATALARIRDSATGLLKANVSAFIPPSPVFAPIFQGTWVTAGDSRVNKTPAARALFLLFVAEHNKRVGLLAAQHPDWDGVTLYEEARRWVIGLYQSWCVREYLASTIGRPLPPYIDPTTGADSYDADVDATVDLLFGVVAFRYGHSSATTIFPRLDNAKREIPEGHLAVRDTLFVPKYWSVADAAGGPDRFEGGCVFRGLANMLASNLDVGLTSDLRNHMFFGPYGGSDLYATNIARARDVGLPDYNTIREALGLARKDAWTNVTANVRVQQALADVYGPDPSACDAYVCGLAEDHVGSSMMGELFSTVIERQFLKLRNGDRFWFERPSMNSQEEINEIYGIKVADLIVEHFPDVDRAALPTSTFSVDERQLNYTDAADSFFYPAVEGAPDDLTIVDVAPTYRLSWRISEDGKRATFLIQAKGAGWIGLGFDPLPNTMKGADIMLCRVDPASGQGECRDSYAADVGPPALDSALGGASQLQDVSVVQENGFTSALFTRPLAAGDTWDKPIEDAPMKIIFAFNPTENELLYHGPTRSAARIVNFVSDYERPEGPPVQTRMALGLVVFAGVVAGVGIVFSVANMVVIGVKSEHFKYQTPLFCQFILVGTILGYVAVLTSLPEPQTALCTTQVWLFGVSYVLVFGCLFAKVFRVWRIAGSKKLSKDVVVTEVDILKPVVGFLLIEVLYLSVWTALDMPSAKAQLFDRLVWQTCQTGGLYWWIVFLAYKALFLVFGVFLAVQIRNFDSALNESKQVALCLYVMLIDITIMVPIGYSLNNVPVVPFIVFAFGIAIPYLVITGVLFAGNVLRIFQGKEPKQVKRGGVTGTTRATNATQRTAATTTDSTMHEEVLQPAKPDKVPIASRVPMREPPRVRDSTSSASSSPQSSAVSSRVSSSSVDASATSASNS